MPVTAQDYIDHASEINRLAGDALRLESRDSTLVARKISIGLSLQAMELVGKSILTSLRVGAAEIREQHKYHDVPAILADAESRLATHPADELKKYGAFTLWMPVIDGVKFNTTIRGYMDAHFRHGATAKPRNYFYPDEETFAGPKPIQSIFVMTEHLIEVAKEVSRLAR